MKALPPFALLLVCACVPTFGFSYTNKCASSSECGTGLICNNSACVTPECTKNADCASGLCLSDSPCSQGPLSITAITGDVSASRIHRALHITGGVFDSTVRGVLVSQAAGTMFPLIISVANASALDAEVFPDLVQTLNATTANTFTVRLSSAQGSSAERDVSLLKGEKGDPGTPFSTNITSVDASTPTLALANTGTGGSALTVGAGTVDFAMARLALPLQFVASAPAAAGLVISPCPSGSLAISCSCSSTDPTSLLISQCIGSGIAVTCATSGTPNTTDDDACLCFYNQLSTTGVGHVANALCLAVSP